uniref:Uncharacterized protein n=1 Tax=Lepeophtheirus salmonis TaxID=72036 RepID=A0A0K2V2H3_LEPSM
MLNKFSCELLFILFFHFHLLVQILFILNLFRIKRCIECLLRKVINVSIGPLFETLKEFFFNMAVDTCSNECLVLTTLLSSLNFPLKWNNLFGATQFEFSHADEILRDFDEALLAFVLDKGGPIHKILVELIHGFLQIPG